MLQRSAYQALLALMTVAMAAGAVWLLLGPSAPSGVEITLPDPVIANSTPSGVDDANQLSAGGLVSLRSATALELQTLPGIGPVLAQRLIDYRDEHGPFERIDQVMAVEGIGSGTYEAIRKLVTVE